MHIEELVPLLVRNVQFKEGVVLAQESEGARLLQLHLKEPVLLRGIKSLFQKNHQPLLRLLTVLL